MIWLLSMALLTAIFTVGLTGKYKDEVIELKEKLDQNDKEWQEEFYQLINEHQDELLKLREELSMYKRNIIR